MAAPCAENLLCSEGAVCAVSGDGHAEDEQKNDCDSSCNCTCCIHSVSPGLQPPKFVNEKMVSKNRFNFLYHTVSLPSNHFGNIWQPPRMVS